jgi:hypothetical protein
MRKNGLGERRSGALRFKLLAAFALAVVVAWSVMWFVAATVVDRHVHKIERMAAGPGATAECINRSVTGFPFRIEVRCAEGSHATSPGGLLKIGGATVAALVYDPDQVIAELAPPLEIQTPGAPRMQADWALARASARLDFDDRSLERFDAEVREAELTLGTRPAMSIAEVGAHLRRDPVAPRDLGLAVRIEDVVPLEGGEPVSISLRARLGDGGDLLGGRPEALIAAIAEGGVPFVVEEAVVESGEMMLHATGELTLGDDGRLNGSLDVAIAGSESEVPYLDALGPEMAATVRMLLKDVLPYAPETTFRERSAKTLTLAVKDGRVRAGLVPLFTLPPVTVAQR